MIGRRSVSTVLLLLTARCATDAAAPATADVHEEDVNTPVDVVTSDASSPDDVSGDEEATTFVPDTELEPVDVTTEDDTPSEDALVPTPELAGPCRREERIGGFTVESQDEYSIIDGKVLTGVVPVSIPEPVDLDLGPSCSLTKRRILYCDPGCGPVETCGLDESCIPFPSSQDVGTVTITGLVGGTVTITPKKPGNNYFDTNLPHPAFEANALILLTSSGGSAALELSGIGVHDLPIDPIQWNLAAGEPLALTWPAPPAGKSVAGSTMEVRMSVDQHGSSPATLTCIFEDTGAGTVPANAVDALLAAGISGFPNGRLSRMTADHQFAAGGCVDLIVTSTREAIVRVAGVTPCKSTAACPSGQTCNTVIELCE